MFVEKINVSTKYEVVIWVFYLLQCHWLWSSKFDGASGQYLYPFLSDFCLIFSGGKWKKSLRIRGHDFCPKNCRNMWPRSIVLYPRKFGILPEYQSLVMFKISLDCPFTINYEILLKPPFYFMRRWSFTRWQTGKSHLKSEVSGACLFWN